MSVVIGPSSSTKWFVNANYQVRDKISTAAAQEVDKQVNSSGRQAIATSSFEKSLQYLSKLFESKNVEVSQVYDVSSGSQVRITDGDTGKKIVDMPHDVVINVAERAKERNIGWIVDMLL